jgi:hypothetical protein
MTKELEDLGKRFVFNTIMLTNIIGDFDVEDWSYVPETGGNSAHWLMGHIALYRRVLIRKLGGSIAEEEWEAIFPPRMENYPAEKFPPVDYLLEDFKQSRKLLAERFAAISEEEAGADWGREFPDGSTTIKGGSYFLHFHESYHIGQIGYIRRLCGKPGLR